MVLLMIWVGQRFKKFSVAPDPPNILWWAGPFAFDAKGIPLAGFGTETPFEDDIMFPVVPKVILIAKIKSIAILGDNLADLGDGRIHTIEVLEPIVQKFRIAVAFSIDLELMKMRVSPAHGRLDAFMEFVECAIFHLNPSPDRRT